MKLSAMVTLYNPNKENIDNIKDILPLLDKVYLVDNSSNDNSNLLFKDNKLEYMPNKDNLGVATSLNIACKKAIEDGYKWILTLDQDSKLSLESLEKMINYINNNDTSNIGIVSPYHDIETNRVKKEEEVEECLEVMTSGNLLNLEIYQKVKGFKDWLFIDDVDIEYCLNLNKNGYKVIRLNNVLMKHNLGNTKVHKILGKRFICSNHPSTRRYYMVRNMLYIYDMYHDTYKEYCEFLKHVQKAQVRYILLFEKDKLNKLKMMRKGKKDYKKNIKGKLI